MFVACAIILATGGLAGVRHCVAAVLAVVGACGRGLCSALARRKVPASLQREQVRVNACRARGQRVNVAMANPSTGPVPAVRGGECWMMKQERGLCGRCVCTPERSRRKGEHGEYPSTHARTYCSLPLRRSLWVSEDLEWAAEMGRS
jgi:hypothetical protein